MPCTSAVGRPLPCLIADQNEAFEDIAFAVEVEERLTGGKHLLKNPVTNGSVATLFLPLEALPFQDVALAQEQAHSQPFIPHCLPWNTRGRWLNSPGTARGQRASRHALTSFPSCLTPHLGDWCYPGRACVDETHRRGRRGFLRSLWFSLLKPALRFATSQVS